MDEDLILVNIHDDQVGCADKMKVHKEANLHRAFSIFLLNGTKMLLQKRNIKKYHSGGLWTNACCSHPRSGERMEIAVYRRLLEELGVACPLIEIDSFIYFSKYRDEMYEYELDHIFVGKYSGDVVVNYDEIEEIQWIEISVLEELLNKEPKMFTTWFLSACPMVIKYINSINL